MTVLSARSICARGILRPGPAGYGVRIAASAELRPGAFALASIIEHMTVTIGLIGFVHDKSTWARLGLAVQNTVIELGWTGVLTIERTNHGSRVLDIPAGAPIAQIVFQRLDQPTELPYGGEYQHQRAGPQAACFEVSLPIRHYFDGSTIQLRPDRMTQQPP